MRLVDRDRVIELLKEKDYIKTSEQEKNINEIFDLAEKDREKEFIPICCFTCKHDIGDRNNLPCLNCVNHNNWEYFKTR